MCLLRVQLVEEGIFRVFFSMTSWHFSFGVAEHNQHAPEPSNPEVDASVEGGIIPCSGQGAWRLVACAALKKGGYCVCSLSSKDSMLRTQQFPASSAAHSNKVNY